MKGLWPNHKVQWVLKGLSLSLMGTGLRNLLAFSPHPIRHFGSCQGPDGSERGRPGIILRSEVLFSWGGGSQKGVDSFSPPR